MEFDSVERLNCRYIELVTPVENRGDLEEVCRAIEYLGGIKLEGKFAFPNSQRRNEALTILRGKYGRMHFVAVESEATTEADGG